MNKFDRLLRLVLSTLDPRAWINLLRLVNHYNYDHVTPRRKVRLGPGVQLSPRVSFRNAERISIGARSLVGDYCALWGGDSTGSISIGEDCLLAPQIFITASNYHTDLDASMLDQPRDERDVVIEDGCWLGARTIVVAGVTIGRGCVVGAGSVVTRSLPPGAIAVGAPARIVKYRQ